MFKSKDQRDSALARFISQELRRIFTFVLFFFYYIIVEYLMLPVNEIL